MYMIARVVQASVQVVCEVGQLFRKEVEFQREEGGGGESHEGQADRVCEFVAECEQVAHPSRSQVSPALPLRVWMRVDRERSSCSTFRVCCSPTTRHGMCVPTRTGAQSKSD